MRINLLEKKTETNRIEKNRERKKIKEVSNLIALKIGRPKGRPVVVVTTTIFGKFEFCFFLNFNQLIN